MKFYQDKIKELQAKELAAKEVGEDKLAATYKTSADHYKEMQQQVG